MAEWASRLAQWDPPDEWRRVVAIDAGALRVILEAFTEAGFYGARILVRQAEPWRTVEGIEFRSITIEAFKGREASCVERK
jgi:arsenite methyltransferase